MKRHWVTRNSVSIDIFHSGRAYLPDSTDAAFFERQASDKPQGKKPPLASPSRNRKPNTAAAGSRSGKLPWRNSANTGHASIGTTLDPVYSHVIPGLQEAAAGRVDAALRAALKH